MSRLRPLILLLAALAPLACVTINVYFPAVAAEKAADRIIEDVWGRQPQEVPAQPGSDGEPPPQSRAQPAPAWVAALNWLVPPARAQGGQPDLDISSPAIRRITDSMEQRHGQLRPFYESGAIGLAADGTLAVRDLNAVPLPQRGQLRQLVAAENQDRNQLYREIALANGHPEWENQIRQVFARRWVEKAPGGWYYRSDAGQWRRKE